MKRCPICGAGIIADNIYTHESIICYYAEDLTDFDYLVRKKYLILSKNEDEVELIYYLRRKYLNSVTPELKHCKLFINNSKIFMTFIFSNQSKITEEIFINNQAFELKKEIRNLIVLDDRFLDKIFKSIHINPSV